MPGDIETEHLFLEGQALVRLPFGDDLGRGARPARRLGQELEERTLPLGPIALLAPAALEGAVGRGQEMRAGEAERVERARLQEALDHTPVDEPEVDTRAEVVERPERPLLASDLQDRLHRRLADVLDGGQA